MKKILIIIVLLCVISCTKLTTKYEFKYLAAIGVVDNVYTKTINNYPPKLCVEIEFSKPHYWYNCNPNSSIFGITNDGSYESNQFLFLYHEQKFTNNYKKYPNGWKTSRGSKSSWVSDWKLKKTHEIDLSYINIPYTKWVGRRVYIFESYNIAWNYNGGKTQNRNNGVIDMDTQEWLAR